MKQVLEPHSKSSGLPLAIDVHVGWIRPWRSWVKHSWADISVPVPYPALCGVSVVKSDPVYYRPLTIVCHVGPRDPSTVEYGISGGGFLDKRPAYCRTAPRVYCHLAVVPSDRCDSSRRKTPNILRDGSPVHRHICGVYIKGRLVVVLPPTFYFAA